MSDPKKVYNETRLRNIKRAKLKYLEATLQLQQKQKAEPQEIHQTMQDISKIRQELNKN